MAKAMPFQTSPKQNVVPNVFVAMAFQGSFLE
jgi:hypothetical protein